jgi:hypothetical protein
MSALQETTPTPETAAHAGAPEPERLSHRANSGTFLAMFAVVELAWLALIAYLVYALV